MRLTCSDQRSCEKRCIVESLARSRTAVLVTTLLQVHLRQEGIEPVLLMGIEDSSFASIREYIDHTGFIYLELSLNSCCFILSVRAS